MLCLPGHFTPPSHTEVSALPPGHEQRPGLPFTPLSPFMSHQGQMLLLHFSVSYQHLPQPLCGHLISYNSLSEYRSLLSHHPHRIVTLTTLWGRAFVPILQIRRQAQRDQVAEVESDLLQPELQGLLPSKMSAVTTCPPHPHSLSERIQTICSLPTPWPARPSPTSLHHSVLALPGLHRCCCLGLECPFLPPCCGSILQDSNVPSSTPMPECPTSRLVPSPPYPREQHTPSPLG